MEIKYLTIQHYISENPVFIIGMCPSKSRDSEKVVFSGNRTGDFMQQFIKNKKNLLLTNVFNYWIDYSPNSEIIERGLMELEEIIQTYNPKTAILLGNFAFDKSIGLLKKHQIKPFKLKHPSYILRFNKSIDWYKQQFNNVLKEAYESNPIKETAI